MPAPRYALYYTPLPDSPLAQFGAGVLGYDCFHRDAVPHRTINGIDPAVLKLITTAPRCYGFHATLVAPFHLDQRSEEDLVAELNRLAKCRRVVPIGPLAVATLNGFAVLQPAAQPAPLEELADACLESFDAFHATLSAADRQRRMATGLSPRQAELLDRWGFPYVLDEFRFHMTLAGPIPVGEMECITRPLSAAFDPMASDQVEIDAISLMRQDDRSSHFHVIERRRLTGR